MPKVPSTIQERSVSELSERNMKALHVMVQVFGSFVFIFWFKLLNDSHYISDISLFKVYGIEND